MSRATPRRPTPKRFLTVRTVTPIAADRLAAGAAIARSSHWWAHDDWDRYLAYLQSGGIGQQYRRIYLPWEEFKWLYRFGTQNSSQPIHVSVDHQNNLFTNTPGFAGTISPGVQFGATSAFQPDRGRGPQWRPDVPGGRPGIRGLLRHRKACRRRDRYRRHGAVIRGSIAQAEPSRGRDWSEPVNGS